MIENDEQLTVVRRQLGIAEGALISLRQTMLPHDRVMYGVMVESYIDTILALRREIDQYLEISDPLPEFPVRDFPGDGRTTWEGVVRAVDLDTRQFLLQTDVANSARYACEYEADLESTIRASLGKRVWVSGLVDIGRETPMLVLEMGLSDRAASGDLVKPKQS